MKLSDLKEVKKILGERSDKKIELNKLKEFRENRSVNFYLRVGDYDMKLTTADLDNIVLRLCDDIKETENYFLNLGVEVDDEV